MTISFNSNNNGIGPGGLASDGPITTSRLTQATGKLLGRGGDGIGAIEEITLGTGINLTGTTLNVEAGGLTQLVESTNTTAPNDTVPVVKLTALNAATNVDLALSPKGSGALTAHAANNVVAGGNKRGTYAVDWQTSRVNPGQIASGAYSVLGGGSTNTASGTYASIGGGLSNTVNSDYATVGGGRGNVASSYYATASGGNANNASGMFSSIIGGESNNAQAIHSTILGGYANITTERLGIAAGQLAHTRGIIGANVWSCTPTSSNYGTFQKGQYLLFNDTTDVTPSALVSYNGSPASNNTVCLPNNASYYLRLRIIVRNTATGASKVWKSELLITRGANAASTTIVGTPTITSDFGDATLVDTNVALTANTTLGALAVTVTGIAATSLRWLAHVESLEVTNG